MNHISSRDAPTHGPAARIVGLVHGTRHPEPSWTPAEAVLRLDPADVAHFLHAHFTGVGDRDVVAVGLPVSPGAAMGEIVLSSEAAVTASQQGRSVILVRRETTPDDVVGMQCSRGILTTRGGVASHAALVARGWGVPAVVGAADVEITADGIRVGGRSIPTGSRLSIDGSTGEVFLGDAAVATAVAPPELEVLMGWADRFAAGAVTVRANADRASDARHARSLGAQGIGLCRTEHMFLDEDRLPLVRRLILTDDPDEERAVLGELEEAQRQDFEGILEAMDGLPVTIRLLDAPLHEFLPDIETLVVGEAAGSLDAFGLRELAAVRRLREANPMIGTRGVRLGVIRPGLYPMQVRAICRAVASRTGAGGHPRVEIMIPLVIDPSEMVLARTWVAAAIAVTGAAGLGVDVVRVGAMIETPRAALLAAELALVADFFSFGTNDLTQLTMGLSRDDVEMQLLPRYIADGMLPANPFEVIDEPGVIRLVRQACADARATDANFAIGVCGEHAGDPGSIELLVGCGVDSVSCSPLRVPIARLAVAHALLRSGRVAPEAVPAPGPVTVSTPVADDRVRDEELDELTMRARVLHSLRIKGFAPSEMLAEVADLDLAATSRHLDLLLADELVRFMPARSLWALTPMGTHHHRTLLPGVDDAGLAGLRAAYEPFLGLNLRLKELCTSWQLRDGVPNDHSDESYDAAIVGRLVDHHHEALGVIGAFVAAVARFGAYPRRLTRAAQRTSAGETTMFTGVMCGSYHDVWMELHEDLIVVLGIDRVAEGSF